MSLRIKDLLDKNIFYYIKSRGDGNCFYRAFMNCYIIKLISKNCLEIFVNLYFLFRLKSLVNSDKAYKLNKCKDHVDCVVFFLEKILK